MLSPFQLLIAYICSILTQSIKSHSGEFLSSILATSICYFSLTRELKVRTVFLTCLRDNSGSFKNNQEGDYIHEIKYLRSINGS